MLKRQWLVSSLLACLVLVNGFMAAPSVAHAGHHATHQASTHSTALCAWLCAAGQGIETSPVVLQSTFRAIDLVVRRWTHRPQRPFSVPIFLRGPPALS